MMIRTSYGIRTKKMATKNFSTWCWPAFDWEASGKFPTLTEPYDGYAGIDFTEEFGPQALIMRMRAEGLKVGFYHSVIDWHHPQYDFNAAKKLPYPKGGASISVTPRNHSRYIDFLHAQTDELMSNYGKVDVVWWDYSSVDFQGDEAWRAMELIDIASKGGNYLLNIGPKADGAIPKESIDRMTDVGKWMEVNAESIRGTTASPVDKPGFDGRITSKGNTHYLHVFSRPDSGRIKVPIKAQKATLLAGDGNLEIQARGSETTVQLPADLPDPIATVVRLD